MSKFYVVRDGELVDVTEAVRAAPEPRVHLQTDKGFENLRTVEGHDVSSRTKWKDYMKARGVVPASEFTSEWARAEKIRAEIKAGTNAEYNRKRREAVARAVHASRETLRAAGRRSRQRAPMVARTIVEKTQGS